jgi:hypothetical protein
MRRLIAALTFLALASAPASPQFLMPGVVIGGGSPPPTCSNVLDFSQACNSQYINVVGL